jgi:hypothetical protein
LTVGCRTVRRPTKLTSTPNEDRVNDVNSTPDPLSGPESPQPAEGTPVTPSPPTGGGLGPGAVIWIAAAVAVLMLALGVTATVVFMNRSMRSAPVAPLTASASQAPPAAGHWVSGKLVLTDSETAVWGCAGRGGYDDINAGLQVTLENGSGEVLAAGELSEGTVEPGSASTCTYSFDFADVPEDENFYVLQMSHRGGITKSHSELVADDWTFEISLG